MEKYHDKMEASIFFGNFYFFWKLLYYYRSFHASKFLRNRSIPFDISGNDINDLNPENI